MGALRGLPSISAARSFQCPTAAGARAATDVEVGRTDQRPKLVEPHGTQPSRNPQNPSTRSTGINTCPLLYSSTLSSILISVHLPLVPRLTQSPHTHTAPLGQTSLPFPPTRTLTPTRNSRTPAQPTSSRTFPLRVARRLPILLDRLPAVTVDQDSKSTPDPLSLGDKTFTFASSDERTVLGFATYEALRWTSSTQASTVTERLGQPRSSEKASVLTEVLS